MCNQLALFNKIDFEFEERCRFCHKYIEKFTVKTLKFGVPLCDPCVEHFEKEDEKEQKKKGTKKP